MISISEILRPQHVNLALVAEDQAAGVQEVLIKLSGDPRITDWNALNHAVIQRNAPAISCNDCGVCIAHGRTNAVQSLVMAAGRSAQGLASSDIGDHVRLIFVAGIPSAFDSEYLRIVGAIARICHNESLLKKLLTINDPSQFIGLLAMEEAKL